LELAASIYGLPVREQGGLVLPWDATKVSIERLATLFNHLPIFLDDSQTTKDKVISPALYMIANGRGKLRGAIKGSQEATHWRTVCFSTGERPITEVTEYEGVRARVIEIFGSPFDEVNTKLVHEIKNCIYANYGHACIPFIEEVVKIYKDKDLRHKLKESYREKRAILAQIGTGKENIVDRMSLNFAAVWIAGELAEKVLNINGDPEKVVKTVFAEVCGIKVEEGDLVSRALSLIVSWVHGNINYFDTDRIADITGEQLRGEIYGVMRENEFIAIFPHKLKELLQRNGFSYNALTQSFNTRGIIQGDGSHLSTYVRYRGQRSRMIKLVWEKIKDFV